jgi:type I restriction enzyme, R subunit
MRRDSNFDFMMRQFYPAFKYAFKAEELVLPNPRAACYFMRLALEEEINHMFFWDATLCSQDFKKTLAERINEKFFGQLVGEVLLRKARLIYDCGTKALTQTGSISPQIAIIAFRELFHFSYWFVRIYGGVERVNPNAQINPNLYVDIPKADSSAEKIQQMFEEHNANHRAKQEKQKAILMTEEAHTCIETEYQRLQNRIMSTKQT